MKILFTKKGIEKEVSEKLGKRLVCDFENFIQIKFKPIKKLNLENASLVFTSKNAVKGFLFNDFTFNKGQKIYCVGEKTKTLVEENEGVVLLCEKNAEELCVKLQNLPEKETFLHFCGNFALNIFKNTLKNYQKIEVYDTELLYPKISKKYDAVIFFSPSSVRSFAKNNCFDDLQLFSIGETTSEEILKFTENQIVTSKENSLVDLLKMLKPNWQ